MSAERSGSIDLDEIQFRPRLSESQNTIVIG